MKLAQEAKLREAIEQQLNTITNKYSKLKIEFDIIEEKRHFEEEELAKHVCTFLNEEGIERVREALKVAQSTKYSKAEEKLVECKHRVSTLGRLDLEKQTYKISLQDFQLLEDP